ncbi:MAG TPA: menaquinone biosynthesis protein [Blastocatellia bacterium]|jgi:chorismate dehydratase|nr:menaquinone biosynthesis protein [Blastocatellia bacterium]
MRIAASTYLNSAPLVYSFNQGFLCKRYDFIGDEAPSRCAEMLRMRQCEIALIPVIELQRIPGLRIVPEIAVASKKRVRSVLIASRRPLEEVRTLTLDPASRTSQALVKILFLRRYGFLPECAERAIGHSVNPPNLFDDADAALVIGDPAMRLAASAHRLDLKIYDLAEEWWAMTGLPCVFAVWAAREDVCDRSSGLPGLVDDLIAAKHEGVNHIERIATQYAAELELPKSELLDYLSHNVNYDLDDENLLGMATYFDLAHECGLLPQPRSMLFV